MKIRLAFIAFCVCLVPLVAAANKQEFGTHPNVVNMG